MENSEENPNVNLADSQNINPSEANPIVESTEVNNQNNNVMESKESNIPLQNMESNEINNITLNPNAESNQMLTMESNQIKNPSIDSNPLSNQNINLNDERNESTNPNINKSMETGQLGSPGLDISSSQINNSSEILNASKNTMPKPLKVNSSLNSSHLKSKSFSVNKSMKSQTFVPQITIKNAPETINMAEIVDKFMAESNSNLEYNLTRLSTYDYIITLADESVSLYFTHYLNSAIGSAETKIYMELVPSSNDNKVPKKHENKRKISKETIEKLYLGICPSIGRKREKKRNAFYFKEFGGYKGKLGSMDLLKSAVHKDKWNAPTNFIVFQGNKGAISHSVVNEKPQRDPYVAPTYNFRNEDKSKWVSPTNFFV